VVWPLVFLIYIFIEFFFKLRVIYRFDFLASLFFGTAEGFGMRFGLPMPSQIGFFSDWALTVNSFGEVLPVSSFFLGLLLRLSVKGSNFRNSFIRFSKVLISSLSIRFWMYTGKPKTMRFIRVSIANFGSASISKVSFLRTYSNNDPFMYLKVYAYHRGAHPFSAYVSKNESRQLPQSDWSVYRSSADRYQFCGDSSKSSLNISGHFSILISNIYFWLVLNSKTLNFQYFQLNVCLILMICMVSYNNLKASYI